MRLNSNYTSFNILSSCEESEEENGRYKQNVSFKQGRIRSEPEPKNTISTSGKYHIEIRQILGAERIRIGISCVHCFYVWQCWSMKCTTDEQQKPPTPAENKCIACIITAPGHPLISVVIQYPTWQRTLPKLPSSQHPFIPLPSSSFPFNSFSLFLPTDSTLKFIPDDLI